MEEENTSCVICNKPLLAGQTVSVASKGLKGLIDSSIKRGDDLHIQFRHLESVTVHKECRKTYTRSTSIRAYLASTANIENASEGSTLPPMRRSEISSFDFKENCLFCGMEAGFLRKTPLKYRKPIHLVQTLNIKHTILKYAENRNDDWGDIVRARIGSVVDLVASEGRYHSDCYARFSNKTHPSSSTGGRGRPADEELKQAFLKVCDYINESDDCQHLISDLIQLMRDLSGIEEVYEVKHFKTLLIKHFGDRVVITNIQKKPSIVTLKATADKALTESWYSEKCKDPDDEIRRIVITAARLLRGAIQNEVYDNSYYPSVEDIRTGGLNAVPRLLDLFTNELTKRRRKSSDESQDVKRKRQMINHMILKLCRPRSFQSPIISALGLYLSRQYGSKNLNTIGSSLGFTPSYYETEVYLQSLLKESKVEIEEECFFQFVFDNIDINVRTLDGMDTYHALGGIQCVTPKSAVSSTIRVPRSKSFDLNGSFNIPVLLYGKRANSGLKKVTVQVLSNEMSEQSVVSTRNLLWLSTYTLDTVPLPGWSGYMHNCYDDRKDFETSYVLALPFIDVNPGNPTAIFSALSYAANQSKLADQPCIVTFDQPLFLKAADIVANAAGNSNIANVIVRLGGFHLVMSFLGCLGKFLEGSGIEEVWSTVYGKATLPHLLSGHAYARSYRAHMMTQAALMMLILEEFPDLKLQIATNLEDINRQILAKEKSIEEAIDDCKTKEVMSLFEEKCKLLRERNRTSKLWIQEFQLVNLILDFILAERIGAWQLHINTVCKMLPYFHAAGHLPYAKSAHLYVQQMLNLQKTMKKDEFDKFVNKSCFTVRRSNHFFTGNWTDMTIEQTLMRTSKSIGGLTHGRGLSERTLTKFIACSPGYLNISEAFEEFCGCSIMFSEQHTELRSSRRERDLQDINKFVNWFQGHHPFRQDNELVSLSSGFVVTKYDVNCDDAYEVGLCSMKEIEGNNFADLKVKRKNKVKTIAAVASSITVRSEDVAINPDQLFNRVICISQGTQNFKQYFQYELSPYPLSLFENNKMLRKGTKSSIMKIFDKWRVSEEEQENLINKIHVIDGGYLLHSIVWPSRETYDNIVNSYVTHVIQRYGKECFVIFDGYPEYPTTKGIEHIRRGNKTSPQINFTIGMVCSVNQNEFLANPKNKQKLIDFIVLKLTNEHISATVAEDDADVDIIQKAISVSKSHNQSSVIVIGQDTDLLILLVGLPESGKSSLFFQKQSHTNSAATLYDINKIREEIGEIKNALLFIHAATGCDTTSALFGKGKLQSFRILQKSEQLRTKIMTFNASVVHREQIKKAGEDFILSLYGCSNSNSLDESRYATYLKAVARMSLKSKFNMASLPPTSAAAEQHSYRTYYQVQKWLGNKDVNPVEWGWSLANGTLYPLHSTKPPAPEEVIKLVSCNCKVSCKNNCSCVKASLDCTAMCGVCRGCCTNVTVIHEEDPVEDVMDVQGTGFNN